MILQDTVEIRLNAKNVVYWEAKGYWIQPRLDSRKRLKSFLRGAKLLVKVCDLPPKSNTAVLVKCDCCGKERKVAFSSYGDLCWKCNLDRQKGKEHPRYDQSSDVVGPDRAFQLYIKRAYNLGFKEYISILGQQNHSCGICNRPQAEEGRRFAIDHNHQTGKFRGILCQSCNTAIGLLQDSPTVILKAAAYLLAQK